MPSARSPDRDDRPKLPGFVIERELGRGSMSVVYLARQPSLGRLVALKVVRSGPSAGSREYARWLREGRSFSLRFGTRTSCGSTTSARPAAGCTWSSSMSPAGR